MPIYEYRCSSCEEVIEKLQRLSDPPLVDCPLCGGQLSKLISAPAIQFKGSGWYVTDYADKNKGSKGSDSGKSAKNQDSTNDTKASSTETKSESSSEKKKTTAAPSKSASKDA